MNLQSPIFLASSPLLTALFLCVVAFVVSLAVYPLILRLAFRRNVMDTPNARKLQSRPIPVMGGVVVFVGWLAAMCLSFAAFRFYLNPWRIFAIALMVVIGVCDDVKGLSALFRLLVEIGVICIMVFLVGTAFDCLHGLWGLPNYLPKGFYIPFTIFAGVGIINAINLIDGVDGYCSGYCALASIAFAVFFMQSRDYVFAAWALACAGALVPFILHNIFGRESKMYLGDGGTLMMGTVLAMFVFRVLCRNASNHFYAESGMGLIPFTLAIFAIPVFDTLRVMLSRIMQHRSPFSPDKTHLHHLFIDMGFSHVGTTVCLLSANFAVVLVWWLSYRLGLSIDGQFYLVVVLSLLETWGFYGWMRRHQRRNSPLYQSMLKIGEASHMEREGVWKFMRRLMDGRPTKIK